MDEPIVYIRDHEERANNRLFSKLKEIPDSVEFVRLFARQVQQLEDAGYSIHDLLNNIDDSEGVELDRIGKIIGQPRPVDNSGATYTDSAYRPLLRARILVNNCQGDRESMIEIFIALLGGIVTVTEYPTTEAMMTSGVSGPSGTEDINLYFDFFFKAKAAAVRLLWNYTRNALSDTFTYDGAAGQGYDAGAYGNTIDKVTDNHG